MENRTATTVNQFFQYLTLRDLKNLAMLFAEQLDWYIPGDETRAPWLGKRTSRQQVIGFYELLWKNTEPVDAKVDHIFYEKEYAVITGEFSTKMLQTGKILNSMFCISIKVEQGKITRYRLLEDSYAVSQALVD